MSKKYSNKICPAAKIFFNLSIGDFLFFQLFSSVGVYPCCSHFFELMELSNLL